MSQVSLGRPEFIPGTSPGHPTAKFLYVIFLIGLFSLLIWVPWSEPRKTIVGTNFGQIWGLGLNAARNRSVRNLSDPLNRLAATLSLLQPLDGYRTRLRLGGCDWEALSRLSRTPTTRKSQPPGSKPPRKFNHAIVALYCLKPFWNKPERKTR